MSHYTNDPKMVRVDFWKNTGKWYVTEAVKWVGPWKAFQNAPNIHEQFHDSLKKHFGDNPRLVGMIATCLEPYHQHSHPISTIVKDYTKEEISLHRTVSGSETIE